MQGILCKMPGWMKHKLESRLLGEMTIPSDTQMTPHLWQKVKNWKGFLMKVKEEGEKIGLKLNIQKTKIMAFGPITSWQIDGETMEIVTDFILGGSKITADGNCSHEIKTLALWKKRYDQTIQHIKKQRHYFANKVHLDKAMIFPVVMYGCESWTIKKAEHWKIDTFDLWCWRRLLSIPWTARRSNLPVLKKISSEYPLEGLMLKLKLQYFGHLMCITDSLKRTWCWERLKAGGEGDDRGWDGWMASLTRWTGVWARFGGWWWTGKSSTLQSMG